MPLSAWLVIFPEWLSAILVIGFFTLFGVGLILITRRLVHHSILKPHNDISGFVFSTIGVIYGVMLAFVVIAVLEQYNTTTQIAENESSNAYSLYRDLRLYPNHSGQSAYGIAHLYAIHRA